MLIRSLRELRCCKPKFHTNLNIGLNDCQVRIQGLKQRSKYKRRETSHYCDSQPLQTVRCNCGARGPRFDSQSRHFNFRDYLLLPSRDMAGIPLELLKSSMQPYNPQDSWTCIFLKSA